MKKSILTIILVLSLVVLQAHVGLIYPLGGETFSPGQEVTIEWAIVIPHDTQNWDLYFSKDGGATWEDLRLDIGVDTLFYNWVVPEDATDAARIKVVMDNSGSNYEDESENFTITEPSGINPVTGQSDFSIYPNPARDYIYLEYNIPVKDCKLHVINTKGSLLAVYNIRKAFPDNRQRIPLQGLKPGIYYLLISSATDTWFEKLLIY